MPQIARSKNGYVPRSHAVWYLETGEIVPDGFHLHHINEDPSDDRMENLKLFTNSQHQSTHKAGPIVTKTCPKCGKTFKVKWAKRSQQGCSLEHRTNPWNKRRMNVQQ
jgi:hypothetical protein